MKKRTRVPEERLKEYEASARRIEAMSFDQDFRDGRMWDRRFFARTANNIRKAVEQIRKEQS